MSSTTEKKNKRKAAIKKWNDSPKGRAYKKAWAKNQPTRRRDPVKLKQWRKDYYRRNRNQIKLRKKCWYENNKPTALAMMKAYRTKHAVRLRFLLRAYRISRRSIKAFFGMAAASSLVTKGIK